VPAILSQLELGHSVPGGAGMAGSGPDKAPRRTRVAKGSACGTSTSFESSPSLESSPGSWQSAPTCARGDIDVDQAQAPGGAADKRADRRQILTARPRRPSLWRGLVPGTRLLQEFRRMDSAGRCGGALCRPQSGSQGTPDPWWLRAPTLWRCACRRAAKRRSASPDDGGLAALGERTSEIAHR